MSDPRSIPWGTVFLSAFLLVAAGALAVVAARGPKPPNSLHERVEAVASTLRCPVCQNLSVADSPSRLAHEMRQTIASDLERGRAPDQIRADFAAAYGEWVLLSPPKRGLNLLAWVAPVLLILGGVLVAAVALRRWTAGSMPAGEKQEAGMSSGSTISPEDRRLLQRAMSDFPVEEG